MTDTSSQIAMRPPRIEEGYSLPTPPERERFFGTARSMAAPALAAARANLEASRGGVGDYLANMPLAALNLADAAVRGGVGAFADLVPGLSPAAERDLAREVLAVPEAFSGSAARVPSALDEGLGGLSEVARRMFQEGPVPDRLMSGIDPEEFLRLMRGRRDAAELQRRREDMIAGGIPEAEVDRRLGIAPRTAAPAPRDFGFTQDNPGGRWLQSKQDRADEAMAESERGLGRRGITGSVTGTMGMRTDMFLPTDRLSGLTGLMDENRRPGDLKFDALLARVREEGFDPNQAGNRIVIAVNHRGEPFVLEGNTRIAVARELGIPNVRAEIRYWNGAEEVEGPFSPENVARIAARGPRPENFAEGGEVMMRSSMPQQLSGGIGGLNERAREMFRGPRGIEGFAQYMQAGGEVSPAVSYPLTAVGRGDPQGSQVGRLVSGPAADVSLGSSDDRLAAVRARVIRESGVDPIEIAMREGVDPDLFLRLIAQESGGRATARSEAGAYGFTQLMPGTARELGVNRENPVENLIGGARYLRQQLDRFQEVPLALAAYNAGPGAVERFGGIPPYAETRGYVARIMGLPGGEMAVSPPSRPEPIRPMARPTPGMAPILGNPLMDFGQALTEQPAAQVVEPVGIMAVMP